ncbi:MAG: hypothetical protein AB7S26_42955 [Sandaracinaceae bacterium]
MHVQWTLSGVRFVGLYDPELRRWKWGTERWAWPWLRVGEC